MKQRFFTTFLSSSLLLAGLLACGSASAQSTWNVFTGSAANAQNLASGCKQNAANIGNFNNSYNCTVGSGASQQAMTISSWSADLDRGAVGGVNGYGAGWALSGSGFASSYLASYSTSGYGTASRLEAQTARAGGDLTPLDPVSPQHSFDAVAPGNFDMLLLDFGASSVVLDKIGLGWTAGDADLMVMRWTGSGAPNRPLGTVGNGGGGSENLNDNLWSASSPTVAGWQLIGTYGNLGIDRNTPFGNAAVSTGANQASSWWLVSAYNTTLLGTATGCALCDAGNDSFKFNFIQTSKAPGSPPPSGVPEPGSLGLAAAALAAVGFARRRRGAA